MRCLPLLAVTALSSLVLASACSDASQGSLAGGTSAPDAGADLPSDVGSEVSPDVPEQACEPELVRGEAFGVSLPVFPSSALVWDDRLILGGLQGFSVHDVSDPAAPVEITEQQLGAIPARRIDDMLFVGAQSLIIAVDPESWTAAATIDTGFTSGQRIAGDSGRLLGWIDNRIRRWDISDLDAITELDPLELDDATGLFEVEGDRAYVAHPKADLSVLDLSVEPPAVVGTLASPARVQALAPVGDQLYLADEDLRVVDMSDPAQPLVGRHTNLETKLGSVSAIVPGDDLILVADRFAGHIQVFAQPDKGLLYEHSVVSAPGVEALVRRGDHVYGTTDDGFQVFEIRCANP